jgi:O-antigen/teichoic acid export membrane protein
MRCGPQAVPVPTLARGRDSSGLKRGPGLFRVVLRVVRQGGESQSTTARIQLTIGTTMVILVATLGSGIVLARALGPTERGFLTAAMLFGPLLASIGGLGIAEAMVYYSGRAGGGRSPALVTALCIGAVQSLVLILVGLVTVPAFLGSASRPAVPFALAYLVFIPLYFLVNYPLAILQGRLRLGEFNLARVSAPIVYTTSLIFLWHVGALSVGSALAASLVSFVIYCALAIAGAVGLSSPHPDTTVARELLGYGLRSHAGNLATIIATPLDLLMLTVMSHPREVGYYAIATSAAMTAGLIPGAISMVLFPTFANQSAEAVAPSLARFLLWGLGGTLLLMPALILVVPWAVVPVYGSAFRAAAPISLILVPGYLLRGATQMLVAILRGSGTPMRASVGQIVGLVVLAALLPMGISARGPEGAAVAVTVSAAVAFAWLLVSALRQGRLSPQRALDVWRSDIFRLHQAVQRRGVHNQR